jgi:microcystin-dependent protein
MPSTLSINTVSNEDIFRINPSSNSVLFASELALLFKNPNFPALFADGSILPSKLQNITAGSIASQTLSGYSSPTSLGQLAYKTIDSLNLKDNAAKGPQGGVPAGSIIWFAGSTPPAGYLIADGRLLNVSEYSELFAAIGYDYGNNGSSQFRLPDLKGRFIRGYNPTGAGYNANVTVGSLQDDQFKSHTHTSTLALTSLPVDVSLGGIDDKQTIGYTAGTVNATLVSDVTFYVAPNIIQSSLTINNNGGSETRPANISLMPCIKF